MAEYIPGPNHVLVQGQIEKSSSKFEENFYTDITLPANSPYDPPAHVTIRSIKPIGKVGSEFEAVCQLGGYVRRYEYTDKSTGQRVQGRTVNMSLRLVE